ncbi:MAG: class I SAM-dependent methyltransferase [Elainellaceae cyanobacterium]
MADILKYLRLPEASRLSNLDNPENIRVLRHIIRRKPFLYKTYLRFYRDLLAHAENTPLDGLLVELGSGAGFIKSLNPSVVTSDILPYDGVDQVFSALDMPFDNNSVSAIVMIDVLHHIKDSRQFFDEVYRCLKPNGKLVMIEPANTAWSRFIYKRFHHEPFDTTGGWGFKDGGPLSGANMAIPWIVFHRDRRIFERDFPNLNIASISFHTPLLYLLSGGVSIKQLLPSWTYSNIRFVESILSPLSDKLGLFTTIEIVKQ